MFLITQAATSKQIAVFNASNVQSQKIGVTPTVKTWHISVTQNTNLNERQRPSNHAKISVQITADSLLIYRISCLLHLAAHE